MERDILCFLLVLITIILPGPLHAATSSLNLSKVVLISHPRTWFDAQHYCRAHHSDLVTIRNTQEANMVVLFEGWIGLYHRWSYGWKWSKEDELATFIPWDLGEPNTNLWCVLKYRSHLTWASADCRYPHPFLCVDERLILVQEMKTWEEALHHCRQLQVADPSPGGTAHLYDLASLPEENNVLLDREKLKEATTNEVWVGLRFLAGEWLWVSGEAVTSSYLPRCPAQQQHCGALDHKNTSWKIMSCSEKRNFICSINL
uniref:putative C-type lectin domain family 20 member A n=1 Tax=Scatophagus argus TaxID=75038 RepID=UPI001ED843A7|nr:putative C-type lectin domain family 20 member A [Scatophagus argus]XP_046239337.1 putative C-type lectin domain family 20 member A [Scatophagus argus]